MNILLFGESYLEKQDKDFDFVVMLPLNDTLKIGTPVPWNFNFSLTYLRV